MGESSFYFQQQFVAGLVQLIKQVGIKKVCIAPGSRSTPLVLACASEDFFVLYPHFDERSLGYFALGMSKARGCPVAVICTSGTAVANLLPAVIEAYYSDVPLLILTADRPSYLHGIGVNQTVNQASLFSGFLHGHLSVPVMTDADGLRVWLGQAGQVLSSFSHSFSGPIHLNCAFESPLYDSDDGFSFDGSIGLPSVTPARGAFDDLQICHRYLCQGKRHVIVVGELLDLDEAKLILKLAHRFGILVVADLRSGCRFVQDSLVISPADFKDISCSDVDCVLYFGARFVSDKLFSLFPSNCVVLHVYLSSQIFNPTLLKQYKLGCSVASFIDYFDQEALVLIPFHDPEVNFVSASSTFSSQKFTETGAVLGVLSFLSPQWTLFVSNSRLIRMFEEAPLALFPEPFFVHSNRGASGIDGILSTAFGVGVFAKGPLVLVVGDMAFLYDYMALTLLKYCPNPVVIIVFNNHGGGIFRQLSISQSAYCESLFVQPHGLDLAQSGKLFGLTTSFFDCQSDFLSFLQEIEHCDMHQLVVLNFT